MDKTLPKVLFMGKFNLSEAMFAEGLKSGDFFETVDDCDRKVYAWSTNYFEVSEMKRKGCLTWKCVSVLVNIVLSRHVTFAPYLEVCLCTCEHVTEQTCYF